MNLIHLEPHLSYEILNDQMERIITYLVIIE